MQRVLLRSVLVILASLSFAAAAVMPATAAPILKVKVGPTATQFAKGAAIRVAVVYACSPVQFPSLSVSVTQSVSGGRIAQGFGSPRTLKCDGKQHAARFAIAAQGGGYAFRQGVAYVEASLDSCTPEVKCTSASSSRVIRIK